VALWSAPAAVALGASADGPSAYQRLGLSPFDHERQLVSAAVRADSGDMLLLTKGAPEAVLARCRDTPAHAHETLRRLFGDGARVVAVASRDAPEVVQPGPAD